MDKSTQELIIAFSPEKCTQCMACQVACKAWRGLPYGVNYRKVLNLWSDPGDPKVKNISLSLACLHCVTPACAEACAVGAISKRSTDGIVEVDGELCIGCGSCFAACVYSVPQFGEDDIMRKCDLCTNLILADTPPPCVATCPGNALTLISVNSSEKLVYEEHILKLLRLL